MALQKKKLSKIVACYNYKNLDNNKFCDATSYVMFT